LPAICAANALNLSRRSRTNNCFAVERRLPTPNQVTLMVTGVIVELECDTKAIFHPLVEHLLRGLVQFEGRGSRWFADEDRSQAQLIGKQCREAASGGVTGSLAFEVTPTRQTTDALTHSDVNQSGLARPHIWNGRTGVEKQRVDTSRVWIARQFVGGPRPCRKVQINHAADIAGETVAIKVRLRYGPRPKMTGE
jgi:hypothetical protein